MNSAGSKSWASIVGEIPAEAETSAAPSPATTPKQAPPRSLMAALRNAMAAPDAPEKKLSRIVTMIAEGLGTDAAACFVLRANDMLELHTVHGLQDSTARLRVGDGIIGTVAATAETISLSNMRTHPRYKPDPDTGGSRFKGFCAVPIMRGGRVRGVLALMDGDERNFGEDTLDMLQTAAMLAAELIVAGGFATRVEPAQSAPRAAYIEGVALGKGIAMGTAVLYESAVDMQDVTADDPAAQKKRLHQALQSMHSAIDDMIERNAALSTTESRDILEAYQMFARDRGWLARIENVIDQGLCAEAAVQRVQNETRVRMVQMSDSYIRDRLHDLEDLSNRLLSHLVRQDQATLHADMPDNMILVAKSLGPAALLDYDHTRLKGVVLEQGSLTNHVAIVARALGIPAVGQCGAVCAQIAAGDQLIVDGDQGRVYLNPAEHVTELYAHSLEARARRAAVSRSQAQRVCTTKDGIKVSVMVNAGLLPEAERLHAVGADGIGLFRTELSFMGWKKYPLVATQAELYGKVMDQALGKPVTFRTFDIGGDKPLPYFNPPAEEENPAMGWRAIRIGMDRPAVLRTQFRALIRGANGRALRIMLPFVSEVSEVDRARDLLEMEKKRAHDLGISLPEKIELGVMLEIPSLLWQLDQLLESVDFVSVGTNDLMQYLFAADRCNYAIRSRYDPLSPPMLAVLKTIADKCRAAGKPVSVCGEMASQPLEAMVLVALGYDTLSMPAQAAELIRAFIPQIDTKVLAPYVAKLAASRAHSVRDRLQAFAKDHGLQVG